MEYLTGNAKEVSSSKISITANQMSRSRMTKRMKDKDGFYHPSKNCVNFSRKHLFGLTLNSCINVYKKSGEY